MSSPLPFNIQDCGKCNVFAGGSDVAQEFHGFFFEADGLSIPHLPSEKPKWHFDFMDPDFIDEHQETHDVEWYHLRECCLAHPKAIDLVRDDFDRIISKWLSVKYTQEFVGDEVDDGVTTIKDGSSLGQLRTGVVEKNISREEDALENGGKILTGSWYVEAED